MHVFAFNVFAFNMSLYFRAKSILFIGYIYLEHKENDTGNAAGAFQDVKVLLIFDMMETFIEQCYCASASVIMSDLRFSETDFFCEPDAPKDVL